MRIRAAGSQELDEEQWRNPQPGRFLGLDHRQTMLIVLVFGDQGDA